MFILNSYHCNQTNNLDFFVEATVDASEILHQLRSVVYPIIYEGFIHARWWSPDFWTINSIYLCQLFVNVWCLVTLRSSCKTWKAAPSKPVSAEVTKQWGKSMSHSGWGLSQGWRDKAGERCGNGKFVAWKEVVEIHYNHGNLRVPPAIPQEIRVPLNSQDTMHMSRILIIQL